MEVIQLEMKVSVKLYAHFRERSKTDVVELELKRNSPTVADLIETLVETVPSIKEYFSGSSDDESLRRNVIVVTDSDVASLKDPIVEGAKVKILPPIVGGSD